MTANEIRAKLPTGSDRTVEIAASTTSSRTFSVRATVVQHSGSTVYLGVHPDLLAVPYGDVVGVSR